MNRKPLVGLSVIASVLGVAGTGLMIDVISGPGKKAVEAMIESRPPAAVRFSP